MAVPLCGESQLLPGSPLHTASLGGFHDHSLLLPVQAKDENDSPLLLTLALLFVLDPVYTVANSLSFKRNPSFDSLQLFFSNVPSASCRDPD